MRRSDRIPIVAAPAIGPGLVLRPARQEDAGAVRDIFNEGVQDGLTTFETELRGLEDHRRMITAAEQDPLHPILVAELSGWVLGWTMIRPCSLEPREFDLGEVKIFVLRSFRNYGVGRQLMRAIQETARNLSYRKLIGYVLADHFDSLRLCRATGWREVGRLQRHARKEGRLRDVVLVEYLVTELGVTPPSA
jgi:L-amino acid N-acyltransferase YncA